MKRLKYVKQVLNVSFTGEILNVAIAELPSTI